MGANWGTASRLAAASAVGALVLGVGGCSSEAAQNGQSGSSRTEKGMCEARLQYDGTDYIGWSGIVRDPEVTGRQVTGTLLGCSDRGVGEADDATVEASVLVAIKPETALLLDGTLYVREGREPPEWTRRWFTEPTCERRGTFQVAGEWFGVDGTSEPTGGYRPPYRVFMHVASGPTTYIGARIKVRVTPSTQPVSAAIARQATVQDGSKVVAHVRCVNGYFKAVSLRVHSVR